MKWQCWWYLPDYKASCHPSQVEASFAKCFVQLAPKTSPRGWPVNSGVPDSPLHTDGVIHLFQDLDMESGKYITPQYKFQLKRAFTEVCNSDDPTFDIKWNALYSNRPVACTNHTLHWISDVGFSELQTSNITGNTSFPLLGKSDILLVTGTRELGCDVIVRSQVQVPGWIKAPELLPFLTTRHF